MPSVTHASSPSAFTPRTISSTRSNAGPSLTSRQAAPMQNRVAPVAFARSRGGQDFVELEHRLAFDRRLVVARLRAVRAVFRATAGFDAEQRAQLDLFVRVKLEVHGARPIDELEQAEIVDRLHFGERPVVADRCGHRARLYGEKRLESSFGGTQHERREGRRTSVKTPLPRGRSRGRRCRRGSAA